MVNTYSVVLTLCSVKKSNTISSVSLTLFSVDLYKHRKSVNFYTGSVNLTLSNLLCMRERRKREGPLSYIL